MKTALNMTLKTLIATSVFASLNSPVLAGDASQVTIAPDVTLYSSSIASIGPGNKSAWIQRNYPATITLGEDTETGAPIYPHQSVQIQYAIDCAKNKLNIVAWKMFSQANSNGPLVWANRLEGAEANYRYAPGTEEEISVAITVCGASVAAR
jgi:hypothetical protein